MGKRFDDAAKNRVAYDTELSISIKQVFRFPVSLFGPSPRVEGSPFKQVWLPGPGRISVPYLRPARIEGDSGGTSALETSDVPSFIPANVHQGAVSVYGFPLQG